MPKHDTTDADPARYVIDTAGRLDPFVEQEWLLTNGIGGFASGTVVGANIRRYHGLLCAATTPPLGRILALSRIGEIVYLNGDFDTLHELSINLFGGGHIHPRGERFLRQFELGDDAVWHYAVHGATVVKTVRLMPMMNVVEITYDVTPDKGQRVDLGLLPFVALRDFHALRRYGGTHLDTRSSAHSVSMTEGRWTLTLDGENARFAPSPDWWFGHNYPIETERGQDDSEDLYTPGRFTARFDEPGRVTLRAYVDPAPTVLGGPMHTPTVPRESSVTVRRLMRAAGDFVVRRKTPTGKPAATIMAGYPWFADWGRDTMISLPGLMLTTRRFDEARGVLEVFADYVSEGMIPNVFDDYSNEPHYNTVDASLWFIHASHEYLRASEDAAFFDRKLKPACRAILDGYTRGTRFGIRVDPADQLVTQGDEHTQLTWMDAKFEGRAFTPRQGKAVEINALWHHALVLMGEHDRAAAVADSYRKAFWISPFRGLYDVVDGDGYSRRDAATRPNQIFAASLEHSPLGLDQRKAVVEVVRRELLTPHGLRSLARGDANYHPRYTGPQAQRDEAYHNGTVWGWLIGPFLEAYLRVNDHSDDAKAQVRQWLSPLIDHMNTQACVGQISEVFEAEPPHRPVGCCAQAWSVAEVLRIALKVGM